MATRWIDKEPELLSVQQMYRADQAAVDSGVPGIDLMEAAGIAVADALEDRWPTGRVLVLCGPGNNGGDGFVAGRILAERGREVTMALLGSRDKLSGDAAINARRWQGPVEAVFADLVGNADIVIDALFGAGLSRALDGVARETVDSMNAHAVPCLAVDVPSGVHGDSGAVLGAATASDVTVTFFRRKPGHLLFPARGLCGDVRVADIGIPDAVLDDIGANQWRNAVSLWRSRYPTLTPDGHKYGRGHVVVAGGAELTGAARLAAYAALRVGAGLASIASPTEAVPVYRAGRPSIMVREVADRDGFAAMLEDSRIRAVLVGPGNGVSSETCERVATALASERDCVVDADGISAFADDPGELFGRVREHSGDVVFTPHDGEFARLFASTLDDGGFGRLGRARAAAALSGAVILLKGADTVVAAPDGHATINDNAPPDLATAGSGDVLAGLIVGLMAQGMGGFDAASAAVWLHGAAAAAFGPGLIADDIVDALPGVLATLREEQRATP
ncbi:MAG: bifunctional ADP-dependent NAD(P)H-hydrate dehydratase/NAD(P)H-hydrate epimerase [Alphaproteobacteria bacterium]|nr:bifunctional ADP-dependent NAD(P)H-hydrate dehydratase/NAD(P)H-hydrate epimerase [Alphaproteobacteria bacterium]|tara:strand:+ start:137 stop:1654 length:1518 start_codon:yes stop_codon:yes gene_type:complete